MKNVLFYSRVGFNFFPKLISENYASYHVVHNKKEKQIVESLDGEVVGCFEEEFNCLEVADFPADYLMAGFYPDRFLGWMSINDRRLILGKLISFWEEIFTKQQYHACIHETISFEPEEVLSLVAAKYNCKDLTYLPSIIDNYFYWKKSPYSSSFSNKYLERIKPSVVHFDMARKYIKGVLSKGHNPFYVKTPELFYLKKTIHKLKQLKRSILKHLKSEEYKRRESLFYYDVNIDYYRHYAKPRKCGCNYDKIEALPDYKKIFFPLHYEPEAVLLYFSPKFSEQHALLQEIAKVLPLDTILLVKEHPQQKGMLMTEKYLNIKKRNSNIIYISGEVSSIDVIKKVDLVTTIASSVGLEAIIHGKPTAVFGNVFYDKHPSVYKLDTLEDFKSLLCAPSFKKPFYSENLDYLAKIIAISQKGTLSDKKYFDDKNNQEFVIKAILKELQS